MFGRKKKEKVAGSGGQLQVVRDAFALVRKENPSALIYMAVAFIAAVVLGIIIGSVAGHPVYFAILFIPIGIVVAFFLFTRFANSAAFSSIEGQLGAGASVLMGIRKGFTTTPAVVVNRSQDMVHRSVGRCGVVLVAEGGFAARQLMTDERKKTERYVPGVPVTEIFVGDGQDQVSIRKLQKTLKKLPKKLSPAQLREVRARLKAVGGMAMPIPKGPMPTRAPKNPGR
jgi:F0F1-type ATP synthase assembly protein I